MKSKKDLFFILSIIISLFLICQVNSQKKQKFSKAYLIISNTSEKLKGDSLFTANLIAKVKSELKKKNYLLVSNNEMEESGRLCLYVYVDISNVLKVSARKSVSEEGISIMPYPEKIWKYKNETSLIRDVTSYIKKFLRWRIIFMNKYFYWKGLKWKRKPIICLILFLK